MGLLDGKHIVVTGVLTDASLAYAVARVAAEEGADLVLTGAGRGLSLTRRTARKLPGGDDIPVFELDVTDAGHADAVRDAVAAHWDRVDGVLHAIGFAPQSLLGDNFMGATWDDVAVALHISTYSLKVLADAFVPLMTDGGAFVGLDFDNSVTFPAYNWMGVAKSALQSLNRYLARELGSARIRCNLVAAGPVRTMAAKSIPGFALFEDIWDERAPLGWDINDPEPVAKACVALLSDWFPATTGEVVHVDGGFHSTGCGRSTRRIAREPVGDGVVAVPAPAPRQPRRLVPVGARRLRRRGGARRPGAAVGRLLGVPLVPRDGPRVVRGSRRRRGDERGVRQHQGRPRGATRRRRHLHGRGAGDDGSRRVADDGVPHAGGRPVLRRDVLPEADVPAADRRDQPPHGATAGTSSTATSWRWAKRSPSRHGSAPLRRRPGRRWSRPPSTRSSARSIRTGAGSGRRRSSRRRWRSTCSWPRRSTVGVRRRESTPLLLAAVSTSLDAMASGGIYDHVGGGFARYSVDERWLVPHFEKMLYDQALLVRVYAHAAAAVSVDRWRHVGRRDRRLRAP